MFSLAGAKAFSKQRKKTKKTRHVETCPFLWGAIYFVKYIPRLAVYYFRSRASFRPSGFRSKQRKKTKKTRHVETCPFLWGAIYFVKYIPRLAVYYFRSRASFRPSGF